MKMLMVNSGLKGLRLKPNGDIEIDKILSDIFSESETIQFVVNLSVFA